jgi:hypothetical protein
VRDGISFARKGIPAVAIVSDAFWAQGDFVARSVGMPDIPRVRIPHPVAGTGLVAMARVAEQIADEIIRVLGIKL